MGASIAVMAISRDAAPPCARESDREKFVKDLTEAHREGFDSPSDSLVIVISIGNNKKDCDDELLFCGLPEIPMDHKIVVAASNNDGTFAETFGDVFLGKGSSFGAAGVDISAQGKSFPVFTAAGGARLWKGGTGLPGGRRRSVVQQRHIRGCGLRGGSCRAPEGESPERRAGSTEAAHTRRGRST